MGACKEKGVIVTNSSENINVLIDEGNNLRTSEISKNDNFIAFGGDSQIAYLFNATSDNFSVISKFTATSAVLDTDFSDDENFFIFGTTDGTVY